MPTQPNTAEKPKRGTKRGHGDLGTTAGGHSRDTKSFWKSRLFKRSNSDWWVRIKYKSQDDKFALGTAHADKASETALQIWQTIARHGWEEAIRRHKRAGDRILDGKPMTVGAYVQSALVHLNVKPTTASSYVRKFRTLVAGVFKIRGDNRRYGRPGAKTYQAAVDAVLLDKLTPDRISRWRTAYIRDKSTNPLRRKQARVTVASVLRSSKSLLSDKVRALVGGNIPDPFKGLEIDTTFGGRYKSMIDHRKLGEAAAKELKGTPEYLVFLLSIGAGLRRAEIDGLRWDDINFDRDQITVAVSEFGDTKTESSEGTVDISPALTAVLRDAKRESDSPFVIPSTAPDSIASKHWNRYRADKVHKRLIVWLRQHGVTGNWPIHTLRKEYGSLLTAQSGIYVASAALRHSSIALTRDFYADKKQATPLSMDGILEEGSP